MHHYRLLRPRAKLPISKQGLKVGSIDQGLTGQIKRHPKSPGKTNLLQA